MKLKKKKKEERPKLWREGKKIAGADFCNSRLYNATII